MTEYVLSFKILLRHLTSHDGLRFHPICSFVYPQVAGTLEELVKDHGGKLVCQAGNVNGYQYTL
mgnify:CR=1 FL=1